jgi:hypothetical protein
MASGGGDITSDLAAGFRCRGARLRKSIRLQRAKNNESITSPGARHLPR